MLFLILLLFGNVLFFIRLECGDRGTIATLTHKQPFLLHAPPPDAIFPPYNHMQLPRKFTNSEHPDLVKALALFHALASLQIDSGLLDRDQIL